MVDEDEHSVSKDRCKRVLLLLPVPNLRSRLDAICTKVVDSADVHQSEHYDTSVGWEDLQVLWVLDVTETEDDTEWAEDQNRDWVDTSKLFLKRALVTIDEEGDALVERLSSSDVLQAHGTVHVNNENAHDRVFDPGASDAISRTKVVMIREKEGVMIREKGWWS